MAVDERGSGPTRGKGASPEVRPGGKVGDCSKMPETSCFFFVVMVMTLYSMTLFKV